MMAEDKTIMTRILIIIVLLALLFIAAACARDPADNSVHVPFHAPYHEGDNNAYIPRGK